MADRLETATLGGGCFWCMEAIFQQIKGVNSVISGYSGGVIPFPTYEEVCMGNTGHAEVVQVLFDPKKISYGDLLEIFWKSHDPTTLNRQGPDIGTQYRSVIFYHTDAQREVAQRMKLELENSHDWPDPIVTEVQPFTAFYPAEAYHQNYYDRNPNQGYCVIMIRPKLDKLRKFFARKLKEETS